MKTNRQNQCDRQPQTNRHDAAIRLFQPSPTDGRPPRPKVRRTIRWVYENRLLPRLIDEEKKGTTLAGYRTHVDAWERYWGERAAAMEAGKIAARTPAKSPTEPPQQLSVTLTEGCSKTSKTREIAKSGIVDRGAVRAVGPAVKKVTRQHLARWRKWLLAGGRSCKTANNYLVSIRAILLEARDGKIINEAPTVKRLPARKAATKVRIPVDHIDRLYRACEAASWPSSQPGHLWHGTPISGTTGEPIDAATYWRAAIVLYFNFGFRTQELIAYHSNKQSLRWANFVFQSPSPGTSDGINPGGWLWYVPQKQKRVKPEPLVLALSPIVAAHVRSIRPRRFEPTDLVFPFPKTAKSFASAWYAIRRAAGVRPKATLDALTRQSSESQEYLISHFRKTCLSTFNDHRPGIGPFITGHGDRSSVVDCHYDNAELRTMEALLSLPQPESFLAIRNTRQKMLF